MRKWLLAGGIVYLAFDLAVGALILRYVLKPELVQLAAACSRLHSGFPSP